MKKIFTINLLIFLVSFSFTTLFAQAGVGKLAGKITDASTGEPLIGANVLIMDTQLGAASDVNGDYFILNITPGTYSVRVSYVGYAPKTIQDVRIVANITYELNVELSTDFSLPEIVVQEKKFFEEKATNTVKVVDSDQIARLPVRGIQNIASLQSGVVVQEGDGGAGGNASLNVRGGRGSEVLVIIDGVPQNNLYNRGTVSQVSNNAIEQLSFQVGGFEAKYGQAQSGIISVTTKAGDPNYTLFADVMSSSFTDDYGANIYTASLGGPIIPGINNHTIFLTAERGWFLDGDPSAIDMVYYDQVDGEFVERTSSTRLNNPEDVWRLSGRTSHRFGSFTANLGVIYNDRTAKVYDHRLSKNSSRFYDETFDQNMSFSGRISQTVSSTTYWNLNLGYRLFEFKRYNPFFEDNLVAYGDSALWAEKFGATLLGNGRRTDNIDAAGVFRPYGYSTGLYQHRENDAITVDFDFTSQLDNHLMEFGAGVSYNIVRGYGIYPYQLLSLSDTLTNDEKYYNLSPYVFGYDLTGTSKVGTDYSDARSIDDPLYRADKLQAARNPVIAYGYIQDRFELEDLVLNLGVRLDYFDIKSYEFVNPAVPYAGGESPIHFDNGDFKLRDPEVKISPRIGIGFPVTSTTVFHAQFGKFIQIPELNDVYSGPFTYNDYITFQPQDVNNASISSEETTSYELGFRQVIGNNTALSITLFYNNTQGLVNTQSTKYRRTEGGEILNAIIRTNTDFGTTKGVLFSFDIARLEYFSLSAQYTFQIAEGTGSSTSSSQTAVFRNQDRLPPKVIAPLDYDQTHTAVGIVGMNIPKDDLGFLELTSADFVISYNSGRPYTPVTMWNIIGDNGISASNLGYINSSYSPSQFRIDLRLEKRFDLGSIAIAPYLWVENLLDADNITDVYRSTGDPYTTGWLNTPEGSAIARQEGRDFALDYQSLERTPANFGIPRLIKLGLRINFSGVNL